MYVWTLVDEQNTIITEIIDHKLKLMCQGEKTMIILHSSTAPKEVRAFMEGCKEFFLCYVIDLRLVQRPGDVEGNAAYISRANNAQPKAPQVGERRKVHCRNRRSP